MNYLILTLFIFFRTHTFAIDLDYKFELESPSFGYGKNIPIAFTCKGQNISPELKWKNPPLNTKSFVLIMDDHEALGEVWTHWIIYNLPHYISKLDANVKTLPLNAKFGRNTSNIQKYIGPCPLIGKEHHYIFKLYALDDFITPTPPLQIAIKLKN